MKKDGRYANRNVQIVIVFFLSKLSALNLKLIL